MSMRWVGFSGVCALAVLLTSGPAKAQYTSGLAQDARGPYTNTYVAPWYAPAYAPVVPGPIQARYSPIMMTSINYPGVYGAHALSIATLDYRGPVQFADRYAPLPVRLETALPRLTAMGNTALIDVRLPADAELWFQGVKTSQLGAFRRFVTPPLDPDRNYGYDVRATWTENGRTVTQERHVRINAGDHVVLDLTQPPAAPSVLERVPLPETGTSELRTRPLRFSPTNRYQGSPSETGIPHPNPR
jgi:uncharacterized protein (TIGR03000 family)